MKMFRTILKWKLLLSGRAWRYDFWPTLEGKLSTIALALSLPALGKVLRNGMLSSVQSGDELSLGLLRWSGLCLEAALIAMIPLLALKAFVVRPLDGSLLCHPVSWRALAAHRWWVSVVLSASLYLLLVHAAFQLPHLNSLPGSLPIATAVLAVGILVQALVVAALWGAVMERMFRRQGGFRAVDALLRVGLAALLAAVFALAWGGELLLQRWPDGLRLLASEHARGMMALLFLPLEAARHLSAGRWLEAAAPGLMLAGFGLIALTFLREWCRRFEGGCMERWTLSETRQPRRVAFRPLRPSQAGRHFRLFWAKDIVLPCFRTRPAQRLRFAVPAAIVLAGAAWAWQHRWDDHSGGLVLLGALLLSLAHAAMSPGLTMLGAEGSNIRTLRLILPMSTLLDHKLLAAFLFTLMQGVPLALAFWLSASRLTCWQPSPIALAAIVGTGSWIFASLAGSLGALLPDFSGRNPILPGSSRIALLLYWALAASCIALPLASLALTGSEAALVGVCCLLAAATAGAAWSARAWVSRRLTQEAPCPPEFPG